MNTEVLHFHSFDAKLILDSSIIACDTKKIKTPEQKLFINQISDILAPIDNAIFNDFKIRCEYLKYIQKDIQDVLEDEKYSDFVDLISPQDLFFLSRLKGKKLEKETLKIIHNHCRKDDEDHKLKILVLAATAIYMIISWEISGLFRIIVPHISEKLNYEIILANAWLFKGSRQYIFDVFSNFVSPEISPLKGKRLSSHVSPQDDGSVIIKTKNLKITIEKN
jgi:hypothetical protein